MAKKIPAHRIGEGAGGWRFALLPCEVCGVDCVCDADEIEAAEELATVICGNCSPDSPTLATIQHNKKSNAEIIAKCLYYRGELLGDTLRICLYCGQINKIDERGDKLFIYCPERHFLEVWTPQKDPFFVKDFRSMAEVPAWARKIFEQLEGG